MTMRLLNHLLFKGLVLTILLVGCSSERPSDEQWTHSNLSSYAATFSDDGRYVLVGDTDAPAKLWDIEANKVLYSWQNMPDQAGTTTAVAISADGSVAATCEQDTIVLWAMSSGRPILRLDFPVKIKSLALAHHGDYLLIALYDRRAIYFDIKANKVLRTFEHDGNAVNSPINQLINTVAISPSGKYGLTGGDDHTARLWDLTTGEQLRSWTHKNGVNIVAFYPQGGYVMTAAANDQAHFWNMNTGKEQYTLSTAKWPSNMPLPDFPSFKTTISAVDFSPDNQYIVTGHPSQKICLWRVANGEKLACWQVARRQSLRPGVVLQAVAFSADGKAIYSESGNGIGQKWLIK